MTISDLSKFVTDSDLRKRTGYTLFFILIVIIGYNLPCPVIYPQITYAFRNNENIYLFNLFMLGLNPLINAYLIIEFLKLVLPTWRKQNHQNKDVNRKFWRYVLFLTLILSVIGSFGQLLLIKNSIIYKINQNYDIKNFFLWYDQILFICFCTSGVFILMWIADKISQKGLGSGFLILLGISSLDNILKQIKFYFITVGNYKIPGMEMEFLSTLLAFVITILLILYIQKSYSKLSLENGSNIKLKIMDFSNLKEIIIIYALINQAHVLAIIPYQITESFFSNLFKSMLILHDFNRNYILNFFTIVIGIPTIFIFLYYYFKCRTHRKFKIIENVNSQSNNFKKEDLSYNELNNKLNWYNKPKIYIWIILFLCTMNYFPYIFNTIFHLPNTLAHYISGHHLYLWGFIMVLLQNINSKLKEQVVITEN